MRSTSTKILLLAGALLLAACGRTITTPNGQVNVNVDGTTEITTEDGTMTTGASVPADWPSDVPVYTGADVTASANVNPTTGQPGMMLMLQSTDDVETVSKYYTTTLTAQGWTMDGTANMGVSTIMGASKDNRKLAISLAAAAGHTTITIAMGLEQ